MNNNIENPYRIPHSCEGCTANCPTAGSNAQSGGLSTLASWPVKLRLAPIKVDYYNNAHLLIAADCTAFASASFHNHFMSGKITLSTCPKFDNEDYVKKISGILSSNLISSITVALMDVPCCATLEDLVRKAVQAYDEDMPVSIKRISTEGKLII